MVKWKGGKSEGLAVHIAICKQLISYIILHVVNLKLIIFSLFSLADSWC
jgi:hypothetical protein